ncbi:lipopolysaccharide transport periplasmic protein LptA [Marinobacterium arenosum]|uniref:lipopolysaccharide transport periplasmic protein LptA n=1 Tax=Marinobacterium arenosum TaxID=2862496 RepID=UPI001C96CD3D|nr:lipopolysaccharide transport periplasmic protein LptA [Marinobacterium arenosum]MBY4676762.1 lipopolysaccharide transport periplasmic protein LptA [Marinobacterium arenosum]
MRNKLTTLLALGLLLFSGSSLALPSDREQPIHITADSASIDDRTGITRYRGNVIIRQGSLAIDADDVEMHRNDDGIQKIIATGKQAHFRQQPSADQPYTDAYGDRLVYQVGAQSVTATGNARVKQGEDQFSGARIVYDMNRSVVDAFGGDEGKGRVQMVIQPKTKSKE